MWHQDRTILQYADPSGVADTLQRVGGPDPYRWLEDGDAPDVRAWVGDQNARTRAVLSQLPNRPSIKKRLGELLAIGQVGAATPAKGRSFYIKREGTQNHGVLYVRDSA